MIPLRHLALCLLAFVLTLAASARAEDAEAEREAARRLSEAKVLAKQGKWEQARLVFLQAYAVHPTSVLLWDLAVAELKANRPLEAGQHLQQYRRHPNAEAAKLATLPTFLDRAYQQVGRVQVEAPKAAILMVDGAKSDWLAGEPLLVSPGEHSIALTYGDQASEKRIQLRPGEVASIELAPAHAGATPAPSSGPTEAAVPTGTARPGSPTPAPKTSSAAARGSAAAAESSSVSTSAGHWSAGRTATLIVGGSLTVAAGVVGTIYAVQASSAESDASRIAGPLGPATCTQAGSACRDLADANGRAHDAHRIAGAAFIGAGALGVATLATVLLWPSATESSVTVGATPGGVLVSGRF